MNTATRVPSPDDTIVVEVAPKPQPLVIVPHAAETVTLPRAPLPPAGVAKIASAIASIMTDIGVVAKDGQNKFHNYAYAKMEDILKRLTPLMARNGLVVFQTEVGRSMFDDDKVIAIQYAFTVCHSSGEIWPDRPLQTGMSRCRDSKGGFDDKALNKAHTAARKYFLLSLFQIPTGDDDDADAHDAAARSAPRRPNIPSPDHEPVRDLPNDDARLDFLSATDQKIKDWPADDFDGLKAWWLSADQRSAREFFDVTQAEIDVFKRLIAAKRPKAASGAPQAAPNAPAATLAAATGKNAPTAPPEPAADSPYPDADEAISRLESNYTAGVEALETWLWTFKGKEPSALDAAWEATIGQLPAGMLLAPDKKALEGVRSRLTR